MKKIYISNDVIIIIIIMALTRLKIYLSKQ